MSKNEPDQGPYIIQSTKNLIDGKKEDTLHGVVTGRASAIISLVTLASGVTLRNNELHIKDKPRDHHFSTEGDVIELKYNGVDYTATPLSRLMIDNPGEPVHTFERGNTLEKWTRDIDECVSKTVYSKYVKDVAGRQYKVE